MDTNVFGKPVLEGTRTERALEALNNPNVDGKRDEALAYVRKLKINSGDGVSTLGIFYNATGETLAFTKEHSSYGRIEGLYPPRVQNGQWGAFFHTKTTAAAAGSVGFVVYRVRVNATIVCNPLIAWSVPWNQLTYDNQAYCDIFEEGKVDHQDEVYRKMENVNSRQNDSIKFGMMVTSKVEMGTSPVYEAEFTREDVALSRRKTADQQDVKASLSTTADQQDVEPSLST